MKSVTKTSIDGVVILEPTIYSDNRGSFYESFNQNGFREATGIDVEFVQDNHSHSATGVIRGLHYQIVNPQGKLIRVVRGEIYDVAVDLRRSSPTFKNWVGVTLSEDNRRQLWIPEGCAHGFLVTSGPTDCLYKTTEYRYSEHERCIAWDDDELKIDWPNVTNAPRIISEKDANGLCFLDAETFD